MKNRVAAQYARDRKKVLVDEMAITISDLSRDKQHLVQENDQLKQRNARLEQEVESLRRALVQAGGRLVADQAGDRTIGSAELINDRQPHDQVLSNAGSEGQTCHQSESSSKFFSCLMLTMASLTIAGSHLGQRSSSPTQQTEPLVKCSLKSLTVESEDVAGGRRDGQWWGRQQRCWNPAQMHVPYVL